MTNGHTTWTKRAAMARMKANERLRHALYVEPRLKNIVEAAIRQKNEPGYHRIRRYYDLKAQASHYVGFTAEDKTLRTMEDFDAVIQTIADLLPPDDVDLYPNGSRGVVQ